MSGSIPSNLHQGLILDLTALSIRVPAAVLPQVTFGEVFLVSAEHNCDQATLATIPSAPLALVDEKRMGGTHWTYWSFFFHGSAPRCKELPAVDV